MKIPNIKNIFFIAVLSVLSFPAFAEVISYDLVKEKSSLKFVVIQNNAPVSGKFTEFDADIAFDFDRPDDGKIKVEVALASIEASYDEVTSNAVKPEWLSAKAFPKAVFETTKISKVPSTWSYYAQGNLTLRGKTAPATINFQIEDLEDKVIAVGFATVNRSDYGVGQGEWATSDVVKDQVRVEFRIVALKKNKK